MSTYELDDDLVRQTLRCAQELPRAFAAALEAQVPVPAPSKIGAVVRTEHGNTTYNLWILLSRPDGWVSPEDPNMRADYYSSQQIGRITEVLSEGVDL